MTRRTLPSIILCVATLLGGPLAFPVLWAGGPPAEKKVANPKLPENPFPPPRPKAPPLKGGLAWLNTKAPLDIAKLKGKVVLLDFWTYCCINCMHVLPDLAKLEAEFPNELVVIGVHSAKFEGERDTDNIREAILRYDIKHPVVNDGKMKIWREYGVRSWPTLLLIDPEGYVCGAVSGEGHYQQLKAAIEQVIAYHKAKGTLNTDPLRFELEANTSEKTPLRFPGKVHPDTKTGRLYVADSSQHRVIVADLASGDVQHVLGDGIAGLVDGPFEKARFNDPQGLAAKGDVLYVADRKNHVIRKVDLAAKTVATVAGTGKQGFERTRSGAARQIPLASPWDILWVGPDRLFIAMAGTHQIWLYDMRSNTVGPFAGNGREDLGDGTRARSEFAQPSGLATDGQWLYVADSEISAVRRVGLAADKVETLVGEGLFEFGDRDGPGTSARLQHALGVAYHDGAVYVADTYNNKIKVIDAASKKVTSFLGDKKAGKTDDPPLFDEPGGIAYAEGKLYVADTNNHLIRVIDVASKKVSTVTFKGLSSAEPLEPETDDDTTKTIEVPPVVIKPGDLRFAGDVTVPAGHKLNPTAPMSYRLEKIDAAGAATPVAKGKIKPIEPSFAVSVSKPDLAGAASLRFVVTYYPCEVGENGLCHVRSAAWKIPVTLDAAKGASEVRVGKTP